ncbi:MAG: methylglyoxal synthase, partial [Bacteroidetes bacterium HGW-Bacteroidetes-15]
MTNIVVIAHDAKKPELATFISERLEWLRGVNIIATGRTAEFIESQGLPCKH